MKRIAALFSALVLVFALVSCGGNNDDVRGNVTPSGDNGEKQPEQQSEQTPAEDDFDIGKKSGNTYENKFIGIGFTLDENWTFYTDEQMAELNNMTLEQITDENVKEMFKNSDIIYDVYAANEPGSVIQVILEKANSATSILLNADDYINAAMTNGTIDSSIQQIENSGFTDVKAEKTSATISGKSLPGIKITAKYNDLEYSQLSIVIKKGSYFANIAVSGFENLDGLLSKIYLI